MRCSVIVATHNRCQQLRGAIESLLAQDFPSQDYEIVVVDNGSSDATADLVKRLVGGAAVELRYVYEGELGLSQARNRGIREAKGDILAFIDDDAIAEAGWVRSLVSSYREERVGCVGGKALLRWPDGFQRPKWLHRSLEPFLSKFDLGVDREVEVREQSRIPYGVNISFRREALADNAFSLRLGRTDKGLYGGEEIELCRRLLSAGWKVIYNPKAVVHHIVPLTRTHQDYFVQRALDWGVSRVIVDRSGREGTCRAKQLMSYLLRYCFHMIKYVGAKITRNEGQVFNSHIRMRSYRVSVNYCLGRVP